MSEIDDSIAIGKLQARVQELESELTQANRERLDWKRWLKDAENKLETSDDAWWELTNRNEEALKASQQQVKGLREAINESYPMIAGRVIQLEQAGEHEAHKTWNRIAVTLHTALSAVGVDDV